jgi:hypothetical protein
VNLPRRRAFGRRTFTSLTLAVAIPVVLTGCSGPYRVLQPLIAKQKIERMSLQVIAPKQRIDVLKQRKRAIPRLKNSLLAELRTLGLTISGQDADWHLVVEIQAVSRGSQGAGNGTENAGKCDAKVSLLTDWPGILSPETSPLLEPALQFEVGAKAKSRGKYDRTNVGEAAIEHCAALIADYIDGVRIH